jgi:hypothetical protein
MPVQAGTYYILVQRDSGSGVYSFIPSFVETSAIKDNENNDSFQRANEITQNSATSGHIGFAAASNGEIDSNDWYKIILDNDGLLQVNFLGDPSLYAYVNVYAADGSSRLARDYGQDKALSCNVPVQKGTYYILIQRDSGYGSYSFTPAFTAQTAANDAEDNGSFQRANDIFIGTVASGHIGYVAPGNGETDSGDWYKITVPRDGTLTLELLGDPTLYSYISLYESDGSTRLTRDYGQDKVLACSSEVKADTYYIFIQRDNGYGAYELTTLLS